MSISLRPLRQINYVHNAALYLPLVSAMTTNHNECATCTVVCHPHRIDICDTGSKQTSMNECDKTSLLETLRDRPRASRNAQCVVLRSASGLAIPIPEPHKLPWLRGDSKLFHKWLSFDKRDMMRTTKQVTYSHRAGRRLRGVLGSKNRVSSPN